MRPRRCSGSSPPQITLALTLTLTLPLTRCLRDDLIFFCYLYQRWQYGIDAKRPNEYGQVATDEDTPAQLTAAEGAEGAEGAEVAEGSAAAAAAAASAALGAPPLPPAAAPAAEANAEQ